MQYRHLFLLVPAVVLPGYAPAQPTPSELAEMSLEELMSINVAGAERVNEPDRRWSINYSYRYLKLEGYRQGSNPRSIAVVLWQPGEIRTSENFPVAPTTITQEVHSFSVGYLLRRDLTANLTVPYIEQSTDHISSVAGFDTFNITTNGIGDVALNLRYRFHATESGNWLAAGAITLPTGSINEKGDTPRNGAGTLEQLPYTMQLGSGTYDFLFSLIYSRSRAKLWYGGEFNASIRTGKNNHGYRLGNRYGVSARARYSLNHWLQPGIELYYRHSDEIRGRDDALLVPGPFPYPASITNPKNYGGDKAGVSLNLRACPAPDCSQHATLELSAPVHQDLNGIQPEEDYLIGVHAGFSF